VRAIFERMVGAKLDWTQQKETVPPMLTQEDEVNHTEVVELLLAAGASPLAGLVGASPLHLAFELGMVDIARLLLQSAHCGELAHTATAHARLNPNGPDVGRWAYLNLVHAAAGSGKWILDPCRQLLKSQAEAERSQKAALPTDEVVAQKGVYLMYGLHLTDAPALQRGICTREEVNDVYFTRWTEQLVGV
jgi:hypothetical protein